MPAEKKRRAEKNPAPIAWIYFNSGLFSKFSIVLTFGAVETTTTVVTQTQFDLGLYSIAIMISTYTTSVSSTTPLSNFLTTAGLTVLYWCAVNDSITLHHHCTIEKKILANKIETFETPKMIVNITSCLIKRLNIIAGPKPRFYGWTHTQSLRKEYRLATSLFRPISSFSQSLNHGCLIMP